MDAARAAEPLRHALSLTNPVSILPVTGIPEVATGDDLVEVIGDALTASGVGALAGDIVVVASKIVSKSEGRRVAGNPAPGDEASRLATITGFDAGEVQLILSESVAVLRSAPGVLVVETRQGFVCANAGIDRSNTGELGTALLLPEDSDASAQRIREGLSNRFGVRLAVLVSDTFGRPFRYGLINVALGVAGMGAIRDYRGQADSDGRALQGTELAVADELCSATELVMNKLGRVPVAVVRGYQYEPAPGTGRVLLRERAQDYFR